MQKSISTFMIYLISVCFLTSSCQKTAGGVWEDTKSIGRYLKRRTKLLWKQDVDSRLIHDSDEFYGPIEEEFIPLLDEDLKMQYVETSISQPKETPGGQGSPIPGIRAFMRPSHELAAVFQNLHFNTNEHVLRNKKYYDIVNNIADYMKANPTVYVFIEGHCDERASEAYNLALGTRRSNTIRNLLVKRGVNRERVFTISYGKEKPVDLGHNRESWAKNRRAEFKIYVRN